MRLGLYARVSTQEQQTLALQREAMVAYAAHRGGAIVLAIEEISSGAQERRQRDVLMQAARRRALYAIVVWRLDLWGRSLADLIAKGVEPFRIAKTNTAFLGRLEGSPGPLRDHLAFLLGHCRVDVQHERVDIPTQRGDDERHPLGHQAGNERNITR